MEFNTFAVYASDTDVLFVMQFRYITNEVYIDFMACWLKLKLVPINSAHKHKAQQANFSAFCFLLLILILLYIVFIVDVDASFFCLLN